jgi:hypothetical protein
MMSHGVHGLFSPMWMDAPQMLAGWFGGFWATLSHIQKGILWVSHNSFRWRQNAFGQVFLFVNSK